MEQVKPKEKQTILIIEDEKAICDLLVYNLKKEGYITLVANNGIDGADMAIDYKPDLILLDLMLPGMDGLSVCKKIRHYLDIPILMVTAKDDEIEKIVGLEIGANDYITKPFSVRELIARIKANLRKYEVSNTSKKTETEVKNQSNIIKLSRLLINLDTFEVKINGKSVDLTLREFELLKYLAIQPGQIISRELLLEKVWGYDYFGDIRTVDVTVRRIREKIELDDSKPEYIMTKRGIGYYLTNFNELNT